MEEESPLDVLSRAATMVSPPTYDEARSHTNKELPSGKWKKERRQQSKGLECPLDFSTTTRHRTAPPSYDQSIQHKKHSRPSVIQAHNNNHSQLADDASDPAIDEHFRRSLGKDYSSIFNQDNNKQILRTDKDVTTSGLSVDDHFAKALGDTWIKLQAKDTENKTNNNVDNSRKMKKTKDGAVSGSGGGAGGGVLREKRRTIVTTN